MEKVSELEKETDREAIGRGRTRADWRLSVLAEVQEVMMGTGDCVQCRLERDRRFQGSSRERRCGQANGQETSHTKGMSGTRAAYRIVCRLVHKNHAWKIGEKMLPYIEEDLQKFEEAEREKQEKLQTPFS